MICSKRKTKSYQCTQVQSSVQQSQGTKQFAMFQLYAFIFSREMCIKKVAVAFTLFSHTIQVHFDITSSCCGCSIFYFSP